MSSIAVNSFTPFKVWEKVEIIAGDDNQAGHYLARIQDFINGGIIITEPEFIQGHTLLHENAEVRVLVTREDAVYQFRSSIKRIFSQSKKQYLLTPPHYLERVQRRLFVRVQLSRPMSWARIVPVAEWQLLDDRARWQSTATIDLSGGGVLFKVKEEMEHHTRLLIRPSWFTDLGLPETVAALSQRCFRNKADLFCGAAFVLADQLHRFFTPEELAGLPRCISSFDTNAQNTLVNYIFKTQVALRRKGLL